MISTLHYMYSYLYGSCLSCLGLRGLCMRPDASCRAAVNTPAASCAKPTIPKINDKCYWCVKISNKTSCSAWHQKFHFVWNEGKIKLVVSCDIRLTFAHDFLIQDKRPKRRWFKTDNERQPWVRSDKIIWTHSRHSKLIFKSNAMHTYSLLTRMWCPGGWWDTRVWPHGSRGRLSWRTTTWWNTGSWNFFYKVISSEK